MVSFKETEFPLDISHLFRLNQLRMVLHFWGAVVLLQEFAVPETHLIYRFLEIAVIWPGWASHLTIINFMMNLTDK